MAPHSSTLAWQSPWMEEPGRLQRMGSRRVEHDWVTSLSLFTFMHWRRKWQPTPVFLPGESQRRGSLVSCHLWGHTESDTTEVLAAAAAENNKKGFPCGSADKESNCNGGNWGLIPGLGRSPGEEKGYPFQYSGLENSTDCIVHGVAKSWTRLSDFHSTHLWERSRRTRKTQKE